MGEIEPPFSTAGMSRSTCQYYVTDGIGGMSGVYMNSIENLKKIKVIYVNCGLNL